MPETRSLHRKLAQIMYEAERIPKNGRAPKEMGGYPFVQVGDAADFIRKALAEHVITMMPTGVRVVGQLDRPTAKGGTMTTVDLITTWTLTDGETGETIQIESFGAGADVGDKYSGKASTSAMKYALLTGFLLSTGEDSELGTAGAPKPEPTTDAGRADAANTERMQERADSPELIGPLTVTGALIVKRTPPSDGLLRQTPEGAVLVTAFDDTDNKSIPQVVARGDLAVDLLDSAGDRLNGLVCTISGDLFRVPWKKNGAQMRPYQRLELHRIETAGWTLPVPAIEGQNELFHELAPETEAELDALAGSLP